MKSQKLQSWPEATEEFSPLLLSKPVPGVNVVVFHDQMVYELMSLSISCNNIDLAGGGGEGSLY